jgi:hypothetical protein
VTAEFVYNADGLRVQKTVNGVATKYTLHGKNVVHMTSGTDELHFFYDAQNRPAVVVYNGTAYAYVKSLQGDIVAILDENGNTVVSYGYDAWGAPLWCTGELAETLGKVQSFRYRGSWTSPHPQAACRAAARYRARSVHSRPRNDPESAA